MSHRVSAAENCSTRVQLLKRCARFAFAFALTIAATAPVGALRAQRAATSTVTAQLSDSARAFGQLVASLSERGGYFDTDNLISNERGYLHVMGLLDRLEVKGGAYIGVGPDQNFSYIARVRPNIAYMVDIRRDNMLQHLMFKALFTKSRNRAEYLALWLGRPVPADAGAWSNRSLEQLVAWMDTTRATPASRKFAQDLIAQTVPTLGVELASEDIATIRRFHSEFVDDGLNLQFTTTGRSPQGYYPTLRDLLIARDREGRPGNYLVREPDFQFLRQMQLRNLIVPVVGDLSGSTALPAVGRHIARRGERVSAMYVSNVEDYLFRNGTFNAYARTVASLPHDEHSVMIRSFFGGSHPAAMPDSYSTQLVQTMSAFVRDVVPGNFRSYRQLVLEYIPFR